MIQDAIAILVAGEDLTAQNARDVADEILNGDATACQIAAFITALRIRKESVEHIVAFASALRERAGRIKSPPGVILDTCGTGGDAYGTFNISTAAAIIAAAAGVQVAKHGNRAISSTCGSADVLAELGVNLDAPLEVVERCLSQVGLCFLFAPACHSAMRFAAVPRREVGIRSIFNMVGPLVNPANATHQLMGVYSAELTETFAEVLRQLGSERALVVHGGDGIDEVTLTSATQITELRDGKIETWTVTPGDLGLHAIDLNDILVGSVKEAAEKMREVLSGRKGPCAEMALVNAGAALYTAGTVASLRDGYLVAVETVASNRAMEKLEALVACSNEMI
ncbi:anthranilate phosphoribosyltransferase [bacterium]|nr:anthranilate phosphoribosyltransferase [bacterium]